MNAPPRSHQLYKQSPSPADKGYPKHLLVVPRSDVFGAKGKRESPQPFSPPQLLLLQLPSADWKTKDLTHAHFVVSKDKAASLVIEGGVRGGQSFALHKVETSNAWVLGPPAANAPAAADDKNENQNQNNKDCEQEQQEQEPHSKRAKTAKPNLTATSVRLLKQGSGASFLELRPQSLILRELYNLLKKKEGGAVADLAAQLGVSQAQIQQALRQSPLEHVTTVATTSTHNPAQQNFGLWNATLLQDVETAVVATLTEECPDFVTDLPTKDEFVQHVLERMTTKTTMEPSVTHLVKQHLYRRDELGNEAGRVSYVARLVAKALFRTQPVRAERDLWEQWRLEMPGVAAGDSLKPAFLQGLAVRRQKQQGQERSHDAQDAKAQEAQDAVVAEEEWVYFPVEDVCRLADDLLQALAHMSKPKTEWCKDELKPYLEALAAWFGVGVAEIYSKLRTSQNSKGEEVYVLHAGGRSPSKA